MYILLSFFSFGLGREGLCLLLGASGLKVAKPVKYCIISPGNGAVSNDMGNAVSRA